MKGQRNAEHHKEGAAIRPKQEYIPLGEYLWLIEARRPTRGHPAYYGVQIFGPFGMEAPRGEHPVTKIKLGDNPEEAADLCDRCMALLDQMVQKFIQEVEKGSGPP